MPADRRGERRQVPRDQAYYGACYRARSDQSGEAGGGGGGTQRVHDGQTVRGGRGPPLGPHAGDRSGGKNNEGSSRGCGDVSSDASALWWASYRYNPDHTQQPAPRAPPAVIRGISAKIATLTGQVCNHAVVNRYRDGGDSIGAHSDKALDLEDGSYVVSVSFGAARVMTFVPKRAAAAAAAAAPAADGAGERTEPPCGPDDVKSARRAYLAALASDPEWRDIAAAKAAAAPLSDAKAAAVARERERGAALRACDPVAAAAAAAARRAREAWRAAKAAAEWRLTLEPGSALFFNMAFNADWTHAIRPATRDETDDDDVDGEEDEEEAEDDDDDEEEEENDDDNEKEGAEEVHKGYTTRTGKQSEDCSSTGERIGVTLRRCHTVFDPVRQAGVEGKSRAWRKGIWRPLREMCDAREAEAPWREG